jgi:hypothetical protein
MAAPKIPTATTPEDNGYCPQGGEYDPCYSGDLNEFDKEFEERDARVDATRSEFHKTPASKGIDD